MLLISDVWYMLSDILFYFDIYVRTCVYLLNLHCVLADIQSIHLPEILAFSSTICAFNVFLKDMVLGTAISTGTLSSSVASSKLPNWALNHGKNQMTPFLQFLTMSYLVYILSCISHIMFALVSPG